LEPCRKCWHIEGVCAGDGAGAHEMIKLAHVGVPPY
jgi:hypothetical protein